MIMSLKLKKVKFKPRMKLNHNIINLYIIKPLIKPLYEVIGLFKSNNLPVGISMSDFERTPKRKIRPAFVFL